MYVDFDEGCMGQKINESMLFVLDEFVDCSVEMKWKSWHLVQGSWQQIMIWTCGYNSMQEKTLSPPPDLPLYHSGSSVRRWPEAPWAQFCIRCRGAQTRWEHSSCWQMESWLWQISPHHPLSHCPPQAGTARCHCQRCISGHGLSCNSNSDFIF